MLVLSRFKSMEDGDNKNEKRKHKRKQFSF